MNGSSASIEEVLELSRQKLARARSSLERQVAAMDAEPPSPDAGNGAEVPPHVAEVDEMIWVHRKEGKLRILDCLGRLVARGAADESELRFILQALDTFLPMLEDGWQQAGKYTGTEEESQLFEDLRQDLREVGLWDHRILAWRHLGGLIVEWVGTFIIFGHQEGLRRCLKLYEMLRERAVKP